jgi:hypothetical protein
MLIRQLSSARFPLGRLLATPGALQALEKAGQQPQEFLDRPKLETRSLLSRNRFVAFAQRRDVERCAKILAWTTRTLHSRDKFGECLI